MKNFKIESPCSENWLEMSSTEKGAHCKKCATEVYDFTNKTNEEIRAVLMKKSSKSFCGRYTESQYESLNTDYDSWKSNAQKSMQHAMLFSLLVVFGLSLFSCNNKEDQDALRQIQNSVAQLSLEDKEQEVLVESKVRDTLPLRTDVEKVRSEDMVDVAFVDALTVDSMVQRDDIKVLHDKIVSRDVIMMGVSVMTTRYVDYLEKVVIPEFDPLAEIELDKNGLEFPVEFSSKVYPNPAKEKSSLEIKLPIDQDQLAVSLYDMRGSHLKSIYEGKMERGTHTYPLSLIDLKPGVYLVVIKSEVFSKTVRISKD